MCRRRLDIGNIQSLATSWGEESLAEDADLQLLAELGDDFVRRRNAGEQPTIEEYAAKHPALATEIRDFFEALNIVDALNENSVGTRDRNGLNNDAQDSTRDSSKRDLDVPGYEIVDTLGRGGMGVVYLARDLRLKRLVALKMISSSSGYPDESLARFATEAEMVAKLRHENIVQIFDIGEANGCPFLSLEYIEGGSLQDYIGENTIPATSAAKLMKSVALAMAHAHEEKIIHRDLKPANILLEAPQDTSNQSWQGNKNSAAETISHFLNDTKPSGMSLKNRLGVKVSDFGLAKQLDEDTGHTRTGAILGTPRYMSPEQAMGKPSGPATDIYAIGAILYHLLTGRPPFIDESPVRVLKLVETEDPIPPRRLQSKLPIDLETICLKCLEKSPARRYASASHLADDLERFLEGKPIVARPVGLLERMAKWSRRYPAAATAILIGLIGSFVVTWKWIEAAQSNRELKVAISDAATARSLASTAELTAIAERNNSRRREAQLSFNRGWQHCVDGDVNKGLHWILASQAIYPDEDPLAVEFEQNVRTNLAAWTPYIHELKSVIPHPHWVMHAEQLPNKRGTITLCADGVLRIFSKNSNELQDEIKVSQGGMPDFTRCMAIAPGGNMVAIGQNDGGVVLVDLKTMAIVRKWNAHSARIRSLAWSNDGQRFVTGSRDESARVWTATGEPVGEPIKHVGVVRGIAFSPGNDDTFLTITNPEANETKGLVQNWDCKSMQAIGPALEIEFGGNAVCYHPSGKKFATAGNDGMVRIWDSETFELLGECRNPKMVFCVQFSPDGRSLATGSFDGTLNLWDTHTLTTIGSKMKHVGTLFSLTFSPEGDRISTAGRDKNLMVWQIGRTQSRPINEENSTAIKQRQELWRFAQPGAAFSADGKIAASYVPRKNSPAIAGIWDVQTGMPVCSPLVQPFDTIRDVQFTDDGRHIAIGGYQQGEVAGACCIWDVTTGELLHNLPHSYYVSSLSYNPQEDILAVGDYNNLVRLWDSKTGQQIGQPLVHTDMIASVQFCNDGSTLAVGTFPDRTGTTSVCLWDVEHRKLVRDPEPQVGMVTQLLLDPQDRFLLCVSDEPRLLNTRSLEFVGLPMIQSRGTKAASFSHDGSYVALGGDDRIVRVWSTAQATLVSSLEQTSTVNSIAFDNHSNSRLLVGCDDGSTQLWDLSTEQPIGPPYVQRSGLAAVAFSPDHKRCIGIASDESIHQWPVPEILNQSLSGFKLQLERATAHFFGTNDQVLPVTLKDWRSHLSDAHNQTQLDKASWHRSQLLHARQDADWFGARWHLERLSSLCPDSVPLQLWKAELKSHGKKWDECDKIFTSVEALALGDDIPYAAWLHHSALRFKDTEQWGLMKCYLDRLLAIQPENWAAFADRAFAHERLGMDSEKESDWQSVAALTDNAEVLIVLAEAHAKRKDWKAACELYRRAEENSQHLSVTNCYRLALAQLASNDVMGYRKNCSQLLQRCANQPVESNDAKLVVWTCCLGDCGAELMRDTKTLSNELYSVVVNGAESKAITNYASVVHKSGPSNVLGSTLACHYRMGQFEKAIALINKLERDGNAEPAVWLFAAMGYQSLDKNQEAETSIKHAAEDSADNRNVWAQLEVELLFAQAKRLSNQ